MTSIVDETVRPAELHRVFGQLMDASVTERSSSTGAAGRLEAALRSASERSVGTIDTDGPTVDRER